MKENENKIRIRAAWVSLVLSLIILFIKFAAYVLSDSTAILSDALESIVNVVAAGIALFVIHFASQPADEEHPYGHGKMEFFSSTFEGGLIFFASIAIGIEAVTALIRGSALNQLESGMVLMTVAGVLNLLLGLHLTRVGKKNQSVALQASGRHVLSDVITTVGVLAGLFLVWLTGAKWLDPVVALLVATQLGLSGIQIVMESIDALVDAQDPEVLKNLTHSLEKNRISGIINIHNLRVIRSGRFHHVDAHLVVPQFWDVEKAHNITHIFEENVVRDYEFEGEIAFHLDPCERKYCAICDLQDCPIRRYPFQAPRIFKAENLIKGPEAENK